jgi:hypothetical protein
MMSTLAKTVALRLATNRQLLTTLPAITLTANSTTLDAAEANAQTRNRIESDKLSPLINPTLSDEIDAKAQQLPAICLNDVTGVPPVVAGKPATVLNDRF